MLTTPKMLPLVIAGEIEVGDVVFHCMHTNMRLTGALGVVIGTGETGGLYVMWRLRGGQTAFELHNEWSLKRISRGRVEDADPEEQRVPTGSNGAVFYVRK